MRGLAMGLVVVLAVLAGPGAAQNPFSPAITVNNGVITNYDIEQRSLLLDALGASGNVRELAVRQLTEDRVKTQAADELGIELPEGAIAAGLEEFATARGLTLDDVTGVLEARGIDPQTMNDFVESGLVWREVISQRFRARATPSDADLDAALEQERTTPQEMLTLAEIALSFAERGEEETQALAERLYREIQGGASFAAVAREYSRSSSAAQGGVLEPLPAARLPPAFRTQVLLLRPGQVTRPVPIAGGIAIVKLVSISEVRPSAERVAESETPEAREQMRQVLFTERITAFGQGYLQELLGDALIEER
jgi:peptidyl-prolyl cis-trans isomerase SurA